MKQEQELVMSQRLRAKIKKEILGDVLKELNLDEQLSGLSTKAKQERAKLAERIAQVEKSLKSELLKTPENPELKKRIDRLELTVDNTFAIIDKNFRTIMARLEKS